MRYNNYRQYITLNGVHRESKRDIINNLKSVYKNVMKLIPKDIYEKFVTGHDKVELLLVYTADNVIQSIKLIVYDSRGEQFIEAGVKEITIPKLSFFEGIFDGTRDNNNLISTKFYNNFSAVMSYDTVQVGGMSQSIGSKLQSSYQAKIIQTNNNNVVYYFSGNINYICYLASTLKFAITAFDITSFDYDEIPIIVISTFE